MKQLLFTLVCFAASIGLQAQTLTVQNHSNCAIAAHIEAGDPCHYIPPHAIPAQIFARNMLVPAVYTGASLTGGTPTVPWGWLNIMVTDYMNLCPPNGPGTGPGPIVGTPNCPMYVQTDSWASGCGCGPGVNFSVVWTDLGGGNVQVDIY